MCCPEVSITLRVCCDSGHIGVTDAQGTFRAYWTCPSWSYMIIDCLAMCDGIVYHAHNFEKRAEVKCEPVNVSPACTVGPHFRLRRGPLVLVRGLYLSILIPIDHRWT